MQRPLSPLGFGVRASRYTLNTLRETPTDTEVVSHRLMLRAGMIRQLASGIYSWLPLGRRVLHKVEQAVREEMDRSGAQELLMPAVQPAGLWQESGRWDQYEQGLLLKMQDRHARPFCFGPTHEEVITDIVRSELRSYKQVPVNFYQIQVKFRDETRPRFGVLRAREFIMKDAYSFHTSDACLDREFQCMYDTYARIFTRLGLDFRAVTADSGSIGGNESVEFHALADSGEDVIAFSSESDYAANLEMAETHARAVSQKETDSLPACRRLATPGIKTLAQLTDFLSISAKEAVKTLIVRGKNEPFVALALRGDHQLNTVKAEKLPQVARPFALADPEEVQKATGCEPGYIGPVGLSMPVLVDHAAAALTSFVCGACAVDEHLADAVWGRDAQITSRHDLRNIAEGDPSPDGRGVIRLARGIEVGHIFKLGRKYSEPMQAKVLDEDGKAATLTMGCYGIGVSRLVAAIIEQHHDDLGIIWPSATAPFQVVVIPVNAHRSDAVRKASEEIYGQLTALGLEVLLDDRDSRPGVRFADAELIGIPWRLVVGERGLGKGEVELIARRDGAETSLPLAGAAELLAEKIREAAAKEGG